MENTAIGCSSNVLRTTKQFGQNILIHRFITQNVGSQYMVSVLLSDTVNRISRQNYHKSQNLYSKKKIQSSHIFNSCPNSHDQFRSSILHFNSQLKSCRKFSTSILHNQTQQQSVNTQEQSAQSFGSAIQPNSAQSQEAQEQSESVNRSGRRRRRRTAKPKTPVLSLTDRAAEQLKHLLSKRPEAQGILVGLKKRGCNGLSWVFDYITNDTEIPQLAEVVEEKGVKIVVQPQAVMNVIGTQLDFVEDEIAAQFVFHNPNAIGYCGCGESFNVAEPNNEKKQQKAKKQRQ